MNGWFYLIIAGIFEMLWALTLKFSEGFTKASYSILTIVFMLISLLLLSFSLKTLPMGTAYACWTAIGSVGVIVIGMMFLGESTSILRVFLLLVIVASIVGLKITSI